MYVIYATVMGLEGIIYLLYLNPVEPLTIHGFCKHIAGDSLDKVLSL